MVRALRLSFILFVGACASQHPATQVTVYVDAEPHVRGASTQLVIHVTGGREGETFLDAGDPITVRMPIHWPYDVTITPAGNDATRLYEVEATAFDAGHQLVSQARLRGGYVRGEARHVTLTLVDACIGVSCPPEQTCQTGRCVPITSIPDAGVSPDAGDGGASCTTNAQCDDNNVCNGYETCHAGACVRGSPLSCDDHVDCTSDSCDGHQCVHTVDATRCTAMTGGTCDATNGCQYPVCNASLCASSSCQMAHCSGNSCVRTFACAAGQTCCGTMCVTAGCDDSLECTTDYCGSDGACHHDQHTGPCNPHDACSMGGMCATGGACVSTGMLSCTSSNPCLTASCDPTHGCVTTNNAERCDDGDACTETDTCSAGNCVGASPRNCDDGVACTVDSCSPSSGCVHTPSDSLCTGGGTCNATTGCQIAGSCSTSNCSPSNTCETASCSTDGMTCMRGNACGPGTMCCAGACVPSGCDDMNPCTTDACMMGGCAHTNNAASCVDPDPCHSPGACMNGSCQPGTPINCDDGNPCHVGTCSGGSCTYTNLMDGTSCTPTNPCAPTAICMGGFCHDITCSRCCNSECCMGNEFCDPSCGCLPQGAQPC